jgi:hypothetical protein
MSDNTPYQLTNKGAALFDWMESNPEQMAEFNHVFELWHSQLTPAQGSRLITCQFAGQMAGHIALSYNKSMDEALAAAKERFQARLLEWANEDDEEEQEEPVPLRLTSTMLSKLSKTTLAEIMGWLLLLPAAAATVGAVMAMD